MWWVSINKNPILQEKILEIVENQIKDNNPKQTRETLNRLINLGYSRQDAIQKIGTIVAEEIYDILKDKENFNEKRFVKKLLALKWSKFTYYNNKI